jgi:CheY-like chemotaxis protein
VPQNKDSRPRLLAVDDSPDSGELIVRVATQCGYEADFVVDSQIAANLIKGWAPDVVTLDLAMPGLDGVDILLKLHEIGYTGHVIIVSGMTRLQREQAMSIARTRGLKVLDHLTKPIQLHALRGLLSAAMQASPGKRASGR